MIDKIYFTKEFLKEQQLISKHLVESGAPYMISVIGMNSMNNLSIKYFMCRDTDHIKEVVKKNDLYSEQAVVQAVSEDFTKLYLERLQSDRES